MIHYWIEKGKSKYDLSLHGSSPMIQTSVSYARTMSFGATTYYSFPLFSETERQPVLSTRIIFKTDSQSSAEEKFRSFRRFIRPELNSQLTAEAGTSPTLPVIHSQREGKGDRFAPFVFSAMPSVARISTSQITATFNFSLVTLWAESKGTSLVNDGDTNGIIEITHNGSGTDTIGVTTSCGSLSSTVSATFSGAGSASLVDGRYIYFANGKQFSPDLSKDLVPTLFVGTNTATYSGGNFTWRALNFYFDN